MYRMYLDEVGVEAIKRLHSDNFRYLSLTGVVMKLDHARDYLVPALDRVKAEVFEQDPDKPICFHRVDIRNSRGPFECLKFQDRREEFDRTILQIMSDAEYRVITAIIDKQWMVQQEHWQQTHPYHYLMEIMVEKYAQLLQRLDNIGDIMPEARGKPQDKALEKEFRGYRLMGTRYASHSLTRKRIPSKNLKFRTKKDNIAGLQLCDLLAHPSHYSIRDKLGHDVYLGNFCQLVSGILIDRKYDRSYSGNINGHGVKHLP